MTWLSVALVVSLIAGVASAPFLAPPAMMWRAIRVVQWATLLMFLASVVVLLAKAFAGLPKVSDATVFGVVGAILVCAVLLQAIWDY